MNWEWVDAVGHIFSHQAVLWSAASIGHVTKLPQTSFEMEMLTTKWWSWSLEGCLILGNWNVTKKRISFLIWDPEKSSHLKIRKVFQTNFLFPSNKILLQFKVFQLMKWQLQLYQWLIWSKTILTLGILENSQRCNCIKCTGIFGTSTQRFLKIPFHFQSLYFKIWISLF